MSLFSNILQGLGRHGKGDEKPTSLVDAAISFISNPQTGGLTGLLTRFKSQGMGDIISSWIGTGQNQPIDPERVHQVVGDEKIQEIAAKLGVSPEQVSQGLAKLLPEVVDKATPDGQIPAEDSLGKRLDAVKKLMGG